MTNNKHSLRQGDIYINTTDKVVKFDKKTKTLTLQRGEFTGHSHRVECEKEFDFKQEADGTMYFQVPCNALVVHEEHNPVIVIPGTIYTISPNSNEREYDYFSKMIKQVRD